MGGGGTPLSPRAEEWGNTLEITGIGLLLLKGTGRYSKDRLILSQSLVIVRSVSHLHGSGQGSLSPDPAQRTWLQANPLAAAK